MKGVITVGISASGKTYWASQQEAIDINRDWIRFNVIAPGSDWGTYKFNKAKENEVTKIQEQMVMDAHSKGQDVIISDTNINANTRNKWAALLTELGYEVETKEFPIALEQAYKRDSLRANGVGQNVIYSQYQKWLEYKGRKTYNPDYSLEKAVIFDIDGTLAQMNGRSPFEWDKVGTDDPRMFIVEMVRFYKQLKYDILVVSGRDGVCKGLTEEWLNKNMVPFDEFFIRPEGDTRKDTIVKEEIFWNDIATRYNVVGVVDDRPSVVRMWHELKIPNVICVGNPWVEF